jgi:hypothetical protein
MKCAHQKLVAHLLGHVIDGPDTLDGCPMMRAMLEETSPGTGRPMAGTLSY